MPLPTTLTEVLAREFLPPPAQRMGLLATWLETTRASGV